MLGKTVTDPEGIEGTPGESDGLGYLDIHTTMLPDKSLENVSGELRLDDERVAITGYEIHIGETRGADADTGLIALDDGRADGARSADGNVIGSYLHGLFEHPASQAARAHWPNPSRPHTAGPSP